MSAYELRGIPLLVSHLRTWEEAGDAAAPDSVHDPEGARKLLPACPPAS
jgi:hypothetical protein